MLNKCGGGVDEGKAPAPTGAFYLGQDPR